MIGERIKRARKAAGLNQRELAELANVSAMAISKYEREENTPSSSVLLALSKALGVRTEYFFRQVDVNLGEVEYREHDKLPAKEESKVLADVTEQVERWIALEGFMPTPWSTPFELPDNLPEKIASLDDIESLCESLRHAWDLGLNPIPDLIDTLESKGVKVFITRYDGHKKFNGLSTVVNGSPLVVVGKHWPGDRQRFTLAHELGHLVLKGRLTKKLEPKEEAACHRFAGAFLAPALMVRKALGEHRTWLEPQELNLLKDEFGLSMGAWTYRAFDLGILRKQTMQSIWRHFRAKGWKEKEPDPQYPQEQPRLFTQMVYRALAEDLFGESKAAELLGMSVMDLHACRNMECPDKVVNQ
jgi:Zn-dependent peptidase ImmA (M78 family)/transcriptional regulator with XRE-family HTH domain